mgnify:CR=1 FL=1
MNKFKLPEGRDLALIKTMFSELEMANEILQYKDETNSTRSSVSDLLAYARGDLSQKQKIKEELLKYPSMRTALQSMISRTSVYCMPEAVAASSEIFPVRQIEGCQLRVEISHAETDQYYLIIEQVEGYHSPLSEMNLFGNSGSHEKLSLPEARRGIIQLVIKAGDNVLDLLQDPKTRIFLR